MPKSRHQPTEERRAQVKTLAGLGVPQQQICRLIGLRSPKTLRRYYGTELSLGIAESTTNVLRTAFKLASSRRDPAMTMFWLKTRAHWRPGRMAKPEREREQEVMYVYEDYTLPAASEKPEKEEESERETGERGG